MVYPTTCICSAFHIYPTSPDLSIPGLPIFVTEAVSSQLSGHRRIRWISTNIRDKEIRRRDIIKLSCVPELHFPKHLISLIVVFFTLTKLVSLGYNNNSTTNNNESWNCYQFCFPVVNSKGRLIYFVFWGRTLYLGFIKSHARCPLKILLGVRNNTVSTILQRNVISFVL